MQCTKLFLKKTLIDYGDIICNQLQNDSFSEKLESIQYKAASAITGVIQGTSCDKVYQELGLKSPKSRRWYKRPSLILKTMKDEAPEYLINLTFKCEQTISTRNNLIPVCYCRTESFKHYFSHTP